MIANAMLGGMDVIANAMDPDVPNAGGWTHVIAFVVGFFLILIGMSVVKSKPHDS